MSVKVRRTSEARREENGERRYAPAAGEPGAVEKLLASAYQAASARATSSAATTTAGVSRAALSLPAAPMIRAIRSLIS